MRISMKKNSTKLLISSVLIILIFLLAPQDVAWGGVTNQTVPTLGPSSTAIVTNTPTKVIPTNTQIANTQSVTNPTSTNTVQVVVQPTIATTVASELSQPTSTATEIQPTEQPFLDNTSSANDTEDPSSVSLPLVSVNEEVDQSKDMDSDDTSQTEVVTTLPSFVLPLILVLVIVILYLVLRIVGKKTVEKK